MGMFVYFMISMMLLSLSNSLPIDETLEDDFDDAIKLQVRPKRDVDSIFDDDDDDIEDHLETKRHIGDSFGSFPSFSEFGKQLDDAMKKSEEAMKKLINDAKTTLPNVGKLPNNYSNITSKVENKNGTKTVTNQTVIKHATNTSSSSYISQTKSKTGKGAYAVSHVEESHFSSSSGSSNGNDQPSQTPNKSKVGSTETGGSSTNNAKVNANPDDSLRFNQL